ncbi:protein CPR-5 [Arachis duranensis]|uniref:Protein CPR-5 n=1 Tax=Arachis duranensis TaxID=130453 RepID=A0A6P4BXR4_ARADU|nr:protein CPR-5 [Arachis duranensis]
MDALASPRHRSTIEIPSAEHNSENQKDTDCSSPMPEIVNCASEVAEPINRCENGTLMKRRASLGDSEATSSTSSVRKTKRKGVAFKRRNSRVAVARRKRGNVDEIGLPLGMSFAAVMAQVLYRRDAAAESMSPTHLSSMCTSAIRESLANVFGDKLDGLTRNFEQSFGSTLSTLRLIYESSTNNEGNKVNDMKKEIPNPKLSLDKKDFSRDIVIEDGNSGAASPTEYVNRNGMKENIHVDSVSRHMDPVDRGLILHGQQNQLISFSRSSSGSVIDNPIVSVFEKSIVEQSRSNDLKEIELGFTMRKLKLKEAQLSLNMDSNNLERSKLAMGASKVSFKVEKFKNQLEDTKYGELSKKCIDCLIAGLFLMSSSLLYGAYVYSYERIVEVTESCSPSTEDSSSWWTPKSVSYFNSRLNILWCQVQVMSRMIFGVLMIFAIAYLLLMRSTTSSQNMPVTFILLMLGVGCGYCGKLCVDTLGGNGYVWLLYWETLCLLHFFCIGFTSVFYQVLYGPVTPAQTFKENPIIRYWIRRFLFYATLLAFLPLLCGLTPFASLLEWKDHLLLKVSDFSEIDS